MALNELSPFSEPIYYSQPFTRQRQNSLDSVWFSHSDFGEYYEQCPQDSQTYPRLKAVYNGKNLNIQPELIHAALSGISIKHYYGKCVEEKDETEAIEYDGLAGEDYTWTESPGSVVTEKNVGPPPTISSDSGSFEYRDDYALNYEQDRPVCTMSKMNYRNSFWNLHRPELCKLTWSQNYVSSAIVIQHLHDHLTYHGHLCQDYHEKEDWAAMLTKELDQYVRLKEIAPPRELPPDEKPFVFKNEAAPIFTKCKTITPKPLTVSQHDKLVFLRDEDVVDKKIHRTKEEFCVTIGKHVRRPVAYSAEESPEEDVVFLSVPGEIGEEEEEGSQPFRYDWFLYGREQSYEEISVSGGEMDESLDEELMPMVNPCPRLKMDDFCRAAAKADFSDLRCSPDDF